MFSYFIFLVASSVTFLCTHQVSSQGSNCTDNPVFTPSALVVKYGDPANVTCVVCQKNCSVDVSGLERPVGNVTQNGTTFFWTVDSLTEWGTSLQCHYTNNAGDQCSSTLNPTLYQPPESVSISFVNHTGMMFENQQYTLQCSVQNVAPVQNLNVTFYRGNTALAHLQSDSEQEKPVNETFTLNITSSREDDGAQYWCEAKLELGPAGPQRPPVVTSQTLNAAVYFTTTTRKPEPTTIKSTTRSTTRATTPQTTKSPTTTTKSTTSSATTTTATTTAVTTHRSTTPKSSSNRIITHSFMCLMLLLSSLI